MLNSGSLIKTCVSVTEGPSLFLSGISSFFFFQDRVWCKFYFDREELFLLLETW